MPAGQYRLPADVQALSLTLKRSHLYPRSPGLMGQAIEQYQAACTSCEAAMAGMPYTVASIAAASVPE